MVNTEVRTTTILSHSALKTFILFYALVVDGILAFSAPPFKCAGDYSPKYPIKTSKEGKVRQNCYISCAFLI
jgi:hypothetical protein